MDKPEIEDLTLISDPVELDRMLQEFLREPYVRTYYRLFGKVVRSPRKMLWFSDDPARTYVFSSNHIEGLQAHPFFPALERLRKRVEEVMGMKFNSALVNLYRDGNDTIDKHADSKLT